MDPSRPRLVSTEDKDGKYLALSYVWGEPQPHRTTKANIAAYRAGIDAALLPQTIREAVFVTHALGFRYLWADSLCIVQDSDEDKARELGRMHLVYRHAHITIIAASAARVSAGFLQVRRAHPPFATLPFICPPRPSGKEQLVGTVQLSPPEMLSADPDDPTSTRGWCLQEDLLSPRVLVFTSETLKFHCQTAMQRVGGALHPRKFDPSPLNARRLPAELFHLDTGEHYGGLEYRPWSRSKSAAQWQWVVENYTRRTVSAPADKLVACAAVAEAFGRVLGSAADYLAGIWRPNLLAGLLWEGASASRLSRAQVYRAPTWSWASVDGPVRWQTHIDYTELADVVECCVALKDPALRFGEVVGGHLVLRAAVVAQQRMLSYMGLTILIDTVQDEEEVAAEDHRAKLVPLLRYGNSVSGLVVAPAESGSSTSTARGKLVYRRIGTFRRWHPDPQRFCGPEVPRVELELV